MFHKNIDFVQAEFSRRSILLLPGKGPGVFGICFSANGCSPFQKSCLVKFGRAKEMPGLSSCRINLWIEFGLLAGRSALRWKSFWRPLDKVTGKEINTIHVGSDHPQQTNSID